MTATVYCNAKSQTGLIATGVKIVSISEAPRYTKKGVMYKQPFAGSQCMTDDQVLILRLWEQGIRRADVVYPDGTQDIGVWINIKDIVM
jgi:hypothetical protein